MAAIPRRGTITSTSPCIQGRRSPPCGRPAAGPPHRPRCPAASSSRYCSPSGTFPRTSPATPAPARGRPSSRPPALQGRHTRRQSLCHRHGHRRRRAPLDRLAIAVPLCLSWSLALLAAPELRPFDFLAHDRARLRDHWPLHSLGLTSASSRAGHRLGLATLPQASSASVAAGPDAGIHGSRSGWISP